MTKPIKFRAWIGSSMEYNVIAGKFGAFFVNPMTKGDGLDEKDTASLTPFNTIYSKETPIMQFTGLLDKNGKEIYEGDLVNVWSDGEEDYNETKEVVWSETSLQWQWGKDGGNSCALYELDNNFMVVGNIYQNPELLK